MECEQSVQEQEHYDLLSLSISNTIDHQQACIGDYKRSGLAATESHCKSCAHPTLINIPVRILLACLPAFVATADYEELGRSSSVLLSGNWRMSSCFPSSYSYYTPVYSASSVPYGPLPFLVATSLHVRTSRIQLAFTPSSICKSARTTAASSAFSSRKLKLLDCFDRAIAIDSAYSHQHHHRQDSTRTGYSAQSLDYTCSHGHTADARCLVMPGSGASLSSLAGRWCMTRDALCCWNWW